MQILFNCNCLTVTFIRFISSQFKTTFNSIYDKKRSKRTRLRLATDEADISLTSRMQTGSMCWSEASATSNRNAVFRFLDKIGEHEERKRLTSERKKQFDLAFSLIQPFLAEDDDDVFMSEVYNRLISINLLYTGSKT